MLLICVLSETTQNVSGFCSLLGVLRNLGQHLISMETDVANGVNYQFYLPSTSNAEKV